MITIAINPDQLVAAKAALEAAGIAHDVDGLTPREVEVLKLVAHGLSNKEITERMQPISEKTVKSHLTTMMAKLNVDSRYKAGLHALKTGLVALDEIELIPRNPHAKT